MKKLINIVEENLTVPKTINIPLEDTYILERVYIYTSDIYAPILLSIDQHSVLLSGFSSLTLNYPVHYLSVSITPPGGLKGVTPVSVNLLLVLKILKEERHGKGDRESKEGDRDA